MRFFSFTLLLPVLLLLTGCASLTFYTQAARGQAEITFKRKSVSKLIRNPETPKELASQLQLSQDLVNFAEKELTLNASGSYRHFTNLQRENVVFIVYAAPEFSLEPKTWWYPIVGAQDYRGYFKKETAESLRDRLEEEGFDTYLGGVRAYSTLGFFKDPLLNTFIDYPEVDLAELIFHELTHHRYYEKDETSFNEALAEVIAREGTRRWLRKKKDSAALANYELRLKRRSQIRNAIEQSIARLEILYQQDFSDDDLRTRKQQEFSTLQKTIAQLFRGWKQKSNHFLSTPLNNARLVAFTTYEALVPKLEKCLANYDYNLEIFLTEVEKKGPMILNQEIPR